MQRVISPIASLLLAVVLLVGTSGASASPASSPADFSFLESSASLTDVFLEQFARPPVVCDVRSSAGICAVGNTPASPGRSLIAPPALPANTVASYSFDELLNGHIIDRSGAGKHGMILASADGSLSHFPSGPDRLGGAGGSATLTGSSLAAVPHAFDPAPSAYSSPDAAAALAVPTATKGSTISAWVFLANEKVTPSSQKYGCHIAGAGATGFALLSSRNIAVHAGTYTFTSHARIRPMVWTHVALTYDAQERGLVLYVNGVRDVHARNLPLAPIHLNATAAAANAASAAAGAPAAGAAPRAALAEARSLDADSILYVGTLPAAHPRASRCEMRLFIDDLRVMSTPATADHIAAESFPSLGAVEPSFLALGCDRANLCALRQAYKACPTGYHLCTKTSLDAGALEAAAAMGWIESGDDVWAAEEPKQAAAVAGSHAPPHPPATRIAAEATAAAQQKQGALSSFLELGASLGTALRGSLNPYAALEGLDPQYGARAPVPGATDGRMPSLAELLSSTEMTADADADAGAGASAGAGVEGLSAAEVAAAAEAEASVAIAAAAAAAAGADAGVDGTATPVPSIIGTAATFPPALSTGAADEAIADVINEYIEELAPGAVFRQHDSEAPWNAKVALCCAYN